MPYNPNIPQPNDLIANSQADILANFQALDVVFTGGLPIDTAFQINHYESGDPNEGKHRYVVLPAISAPSTGASECALYCNGYSGVAHLVFRPSNNASASRLTGPTTLSSNGAAFIPCGAGGIFLQWGNATGVWNGSNTITFPRAFSAAPYSIWMTQIVPTAGSSIREFCQVLSGSQTTTRFAPRFIGDGGTVPSSDRTIYWAAIGPA